MSAIEQRLRAITTNLGDIHLSRYAPDYGEATGIKFDPPQLFKHPLMVVRVRRLWNKNTREIQVYLSSLSSDTCRLGQTIRLHWGVENGLHWTLDVTFDEDACRIRTGHAPQNFALLRRIALNALNP